MLVASKTGILEGKTECPYRSRARKDFEVERCIFGVRYGDREAGEGVIRKSVKTKQNLCAWNVGQWLGLPIVPNEFAEQYTTSSYSQKGISKCFRDSCVVARALEIVVNPTEDGTLSRATGTLQSLGHWQDIHIEFLQYSMGNLSALVGLGLSSSWAVTLS